MMASFSIPTQMSSLVGVAWLCCQLGLSHAQDIPDPNPRPNPDGTFTWWVGNDLQYPSIQEVIDAAFPGDEIAIAEGQYVEDLILSQDDLTIRPFCVFDAGVARWADVVLWNPTKGFEDDPWSIKVENSLGCSIGRPRQFFQLSNGFQADSVVDPGEWNPQSEPVDVVTVTKNSNGIALTFWSRDDESVSIYARAGTPTFHSCLIRSQAGFGSAILVAGDMASPSFIECTINNFFVDGGSLDGNPIQPITIVADESEDVRARFFDCTITECVAGATGVVLQVGARTFWGGSRIVSNQSALSDGIIVISRGAADFSECVFSNNLARFGTVRTIHSDTPGSDEEVLFQSCDFLDNQTVDGQYGGVVSSIGVTGSYPLVELSGCGINRNNGHVGLNFFDIDTPFFPSFRLGSDLSDRSVIPQECTADLNGDGVVDGVDLVHLLSQWTT
jgi:hypothetical protein